MLARSRRKRGARHVENTKVIMKAHETLALLGKLLQHCLEDRLFEERLSGFTPLIVESIDVFLIDM